MPVRLVLRWLHFASFVVGYIYRESRTLCVISTPRDIIPRHSTVSCKIFLQLLWDGAIIILYTVEGSRLTIMMMMVLRTVGICWSRMHGSDPVGNGIIIGLLLFVHSLGEWLRFPKALRERCRFSTQPNPIHGMEPPLRRLKERKKDAKGNQATWWLWKRQWLPTTPKYLTSRGERAARFEEKKDVYLRSCVVPPPSIHISARHNNNNIMKKC